MFSKFSNISQAFKQNFSNFGGLSDPTLSRLTDDDFSELAAESSPVSEGELAVVLTTMLLWPPNELVITEPESVFEASSVLRLENSYLHYNHLLPPSSMDNYDLALFHHNDMDSLLIYRQDYVCNSFQILSNT